MFANLFMDRFNPRSRDVNGGRGKILADINVSKLNIHADRKKPTRYWNPKS
jgi:hypothetical protein